MPPLKTSILINCHNYERFVPEAIESVLRQTRRVDELIIVDDGSTDRSLEKINAAVRDDPRAIVIAKKNEGQLSAFNAGFSKATGDILFFLDADDTYAPGHVAAVCAVFEADKRVDFVWTAIRKFGIKTAVERAYPESTFFGKTVALACMSQKYIGGVTSAIAMRREAAARYLPVDPGFYPAWRTRADDWLTHGSAIAGCTKYYLDKATVNYRIHGTNNYAQKKITKQEHLHYKTVRDNLYASVKKTTNTPANIEAHLVDEFRLQDKKNIGILRIYTKAAWKYRRQTGILRCGVLQLELAFAYLKNLIGST